MQKARGGDDNCHRFPGLSLDVSPELFVWVVEVRVLRMFRAACVARDRKEYAEVEAGDEGGGATSADERKRLPGHGNKPHCHHHVGHGLEHHKERQAHGKEGRKVPLAARRYAPRPKQQNDVEGNHDECPLYAHLLNDDGKNEVGKSLAQEVALHGVAGNAAHDVA